LTKGSRSQRSPDSSESDKTRSKGASQDTKGSSGDGSASNTLNTSLPGTPITKLRPRFSRFKGQVRTFDSQTEEKNTSKWQLKQRMVGRELFQGPLSLELTFTFECPKSRKKKKEVYHSVKPDLDNIIKYIMDVGNGTLWYDDQQVVKIAAVKVYGDVAGTEITVSEVEDG